MEEEYQQDLFLCYGSGWGLTVSI